MSGAEIGPPVDAVRKIEDGIEIDLRIAADLAVLEGHFPGMPIVPGVAQIDWAVQFADREIGLGLMAAQAFQVKFRRIMVPGMAVTLVLRHQPAKRRLGFEYRWQGETLSSGSIALVEP